MLIDEMFPSKFLSAADLGGKEVIAVIQNVTTEKFDDGSEKPLITFRDFPKGFVGNKTNCQTIAGIYGKNTDQWLGQPIVLFPVMVPFKDKVVEAVRIRRPPVPGAASTAGTPQTSPMQGAAEIAPAPVPQGVVPTGGPFSDDIPFG